MSNVCVVVVEGVGVVLVIVPVMGHLATLHRGVRSRQRWSESWHQGYKWGRRKWRESNSRLLVVVEGQCVNPGIRVGVSDMAFAIVAFAVIDAS